jgi:hypothetical protein
MTSGSRFSAGWIGDTGFGRAEGSAGSGCGVSRVALSVLRSLRVARVIGALHFPSTSEESARIALIQAGDARLRSVDLEPLEVVVRADFTSTGGGRDLS